MFILYYEQVNWEYGILLGKGGTKMQLHLAIACDHPDVGVYLDTVPLKEGESLLATVIDVAINKWEWTIEDMDDCGQYIEYYILDPDLYKNVLRKIKWPEPWGAKCQGGLRYETEEAIDRCKLHVYRTCKINWLHDSVQEIYRKHKDQRGEIMSACS